MTITQGSKAWGIGEGSPPHGYLIHWKRIKERKQEDSLFLLKSFQMSFERLPSSLAPLPSEHPKSGLICLKGVVTISHGLPKKPSSCHPGELKTLLENQP